MSQVEETRKLLIKLRKEHPGRDVETLFREHYNQTGTTHDEKEKEDENMSSGGGKT